MDDFAKHCWGFDKIAGCSTEKKMHTQPDYDFDTQIVTNAQCPLGERIFINSDGEVFARFRMNAEYSACCDGMFQAMIKNNWLIWDRDDKMNWYQSVTGRSEQPE